MEKLQYFYSLGLAKVLLSFLYIMMFVYPAVSVPTVHNVLAFGAKPNGIADATQALLAAWEAACAAESPSIIIVPKGRYGISPLVLNGSSCKNPSITISIMGSLIAPPDHWILGKVENWISFQGVSGVTLVGGGVLDAKGLSWWACKNSSSAGKCTDGATTLRFINSNNIVVKGITSLNSQMFHIGINGCRNVLVDGVKVIALGNSPNTDGIHVESSMRVTVINSAIKTGDDCISVGPNTKDLWVENVLCGPGHGISIGSLGKELEEQGVKNVTVTKVVLTNTTNGLRIKAWARPSKGFVQGVLFQNITMRNVENPIIVDQHYCPYNINCPNQVSGIKISDVTYSEIKGTSTSEVAIKFDCSSLYPCTGIHLHNVNITSPAMNPRSTCDHVKGETQGFVQPTSCL